MTYTSTMQRLLFSAAAALVLSGAPAAVYAHGGDVNLIHACVGKITGVVRIIAPTATCKSWESPLDWNIQGPAGGTTCAGNDATDVMVRVGSVCVDVYEASVWSTATGGTQYGVGTNDDYPCTDPGNDCTDVIYARSQAGVKPSASRSLPRLGDRGRFASRASTRTSYRPEEVTMPPRLLQRQNYVNLSATENHGVYPAGLTPSVVNRPQGEDFATPYASSG